MNDREYGGIGGKQRRQGSEKDFSLRKTQRKLVTKKKGKKKKKKKMKKEMEMMIMMHSD